MKQVDKLLVSLIIEGQSGELIGVVRSYTAHIRNLMTLQNPLCMELFVLHLDDLMTMLSPELGKELDWFLRVRNAINDLKKEIIMNNRILGILDDNQYNTEVFKELIYEKWPNSVNLPMRDDDDFTIKVKSVVSLIEMGVRRYTRY